MWSGKNIWILALSLMVFVVTVPLLTGAVAESTVGTKLDAYRGVTVHDNGLIYSRSHGRHFADDGCYYGKKWQCVEFVKRFFHQAHNHKMPDVWGHAKSFFDENVPHGELNPRRGLLQFRNGGSVYPKTGDLLVFTNGGYGHVAIICRVTTNDVQVIQQNVVGRTRQTFPLTWTPTSFQIGDSDQPAGWLRVPKPANRQREPRRSRQEHRPHLSSPHG